MSTSRDMSTSESAQQLNSDRITRIHAFRSITTFIRIIETTSASRTASEPRFFFTNTPDTLTETERQQLRFNTALSVCAVRNLEVVTVLSSKDKTDGISNSYIFTVNPGHLASGKIISNDVLYHQTTDSDDATPHLVSGIGEDLANPAKFIRTRL
jgi:hypothetical protein